MKLVYRIREVDGSDDEIAETLNTLQRATAEFPEISESDLDRGHYWLVYHGREPIAFAGLLPSARWSGVGYLSRCGVVPAHRGKGLQRRLMRVREARARRNGWTHLISDCTDTIFSANNFIRSGFKLYEPSQPWAFPNTMYWIKAL